MKETVDDFIRSRHANYSAVKYFGEKLKRGKNCRCSFPYIMRGYGSFSEKHKRKLIYESSSRCFVAAFCAGAHSLHICGAGQMLSDTERTPAGDTRYRTEGIPPLTSQCKNRKTKLPMAGKGEPDGDSYQN